MSTAHEKHTEGSKNNSEEFHKMVRAEVCLQAFPAEEAISRMAEQYSIILEIIVRLPGNLIKSKFVYFALLLNNYMLFKV